MLAVPAVVERLRMFDAPDPRLLETGVICWLLFFGYVTGSRLCSPLGQWEVTSETISKAISICLLMALCWGILYVFIGSRHSDAFSPGVDAEADEPHVFPILRYFGLTMLSTIGFGNITPVGLAAHCAAVAEGISRQLVWRFSSRASWAYG